MTDTASRPDPARLAIEERYVTDLYRILIDSLVDFSVFLVDPDGTVLTWNVGSQRMFGYTSEEIIGRDVAILFVPEDRAAGAPKNERAAAIADGRAEDERWHVRDDGSRLYVSGIVLPLRDGEEIVALAKVGRDRTRERRLQDELEQANASKDEFLAIVSHELRTPLTATLGWAQLARFTDLDPDMMSAALEAIERSAKLQSELVDDLLDVARMNSGKLWIDRKPIDLVPTINAAIDIVRPLAAQKSITITSDLPAGPVYILGDDNRLQQTFWNLLSNAVKFTPAEGQVHLHFAFENAAAVITVTDTGTGIAAEFLPFVFDRFRQGGTSESRHFRGLGLGLSIVRHIVETLGGSVQARSPGEGHGAEFRVELPLLAAEALAALREGDTGRVHPKAPSGSPRYPRLNGVRVLLVEHDSETRLVLTGLFAQLGIRYRSGETAADAIEFFTSDQPDVVIMEISPPDMAAVDVAATLRKIEKHRGWSATPLIALSAAAPPEERTELLESGFQLHVPKPIDTGELAAAIATVLERTA
ncbi:MAG TPA: ATP-binding protein [Thermoanaerobaculia bacterium]|nr:ATP-binding protein [Thermoanaerobaculia bacterium]